MKRLIQFLCLACMTAAPALAETVSAVLTNVPHRTSVVVDFGRPLTDITQVTMTLTSNMGPVSVCWESWSGFYSYPCGNITDVSLGGAYMSFKGEGEIDHQTFDAWNGNLTDWSFLASGVTSFYLRCWADGCSPDWVHGQHYCGPEPYQVDEVVISVTTQAVANESMTWGGLKSSYR